jgi:hypothetical protein
MRHSPSLVDFCLYFFISFQLFLFVATNMYLLQVTQVIIQGENNKGNNGYHNPLQHGI